MIKNNIKTNKYIYIIVCIISLVIMYIMGMTFSDETNTFYAKSYLKNKNSARVSNGINAIEQDSKAWSYRIGHPLNLTEGDYEINLRYKVEADTPVSIKLVSEYDTGTKTYPVIELGVLSPENNQVSYNAYIPQDAYMAVLYMDYAGYGVAEIQEFEITGLNREIFINKQMVAFVIAAIVSAFVVFILYSFNKKTNEGKISAIYAVVLLVIIAISSILLFKYDCFGGDDTYFHISRIWGIADNIMRGSPFNKINFAMTGGYGYMDPVFYPNLFLYIPAVMVCMGASLACAYKIFILLINLATVLISYYSFGKISGNKVYGLFCAAVYSLNYYRMRDIYVRGAVGEVLFITFLPLVLYAVYEIFHDKTEKWGLLAIGATCIFQSHILGTVLTAIGAGALIIMYIIYNLANKISIKKPLIALVKAGALTIFLNIWFLVPFLYYYTKDFIMFGNASQMYINYASTFKDILFGIQKADNATQYARVGLFTGILFVTYIICTILNMVKNKKIREDIIYLILAVAFLVLCTKYMPWYQIIEISILDKLLANIQFAFRIVSLVIAFMVMGMAFKLKNINYKFVKVTAVIMTIVFIVTGGIYHISEEKNIVAYDGEFWFDHVPQEYYMNGTNDGEITSKIKFTSAEDGIDILDYKTIDAGVKITIDNSSSGDNYLEIPMFYYDRYQAYSEETHQYLPVQFGTNGLIRVIIPSTVTGNITVKYNSSMMFHFAEMISFVTFVAFFAHNILKHKKYRQYN